MQRIRIGVTGLAAVVLIIVLATAIATSVRRTANSVVPAATATLIPDVKSTAGNGSDTGTEPLAQLGVAPGGDRKDVAVVPQKRPR